MLRARAGGGLLLGREPAQLEVDIIFFDYPANLSDDEPSDDVGDEFSDEPALSFAFV